MSEDEYGDRWTFFEAPEKIKEKAKVKCSWCGKEFVDLTKHLKTCKEYLKEKETPKIETQKIQQQLETLVKKNQELTEFAVGQRNAYYHILEEYAKLTFDDITHILMEEYDLLKWDKNAKVPVKRRGKIVMERHNILWSLDYIRKTFPEVNDWSRDQLLPLQTMNRIRRADYRYYNFIVNWLKKFTLDKLSIYKDKGEKK